MPGQALLAATSGNPWGTQVRLAAPYALRGLLMIFTTLMADTLISRISGRDLRVSLEGLPCNCTLEAMQ